jgi:hypothetical protein
MKEILVFARTPDLKKFNPFFLNIARAESKQKKATISYSRSPVPLKEWVDE